MFTDIYLLLTVVFCLLHFYVAHPIYCLFTSIILLNHDVFLMSLLFRIVSSLNHIQLPLFMINKINVTLLRQFLGFYCLYKRILLLNHDVFLVSLIF